VPFVRRQKPIEGRSRVVTSLRGDVVEVLDRLASKHETSRSEVVARIVERATAPAASPSESLEARRTPSLDYAMIAALAPCNPHR
jgi:hypothetical protein